MVIFRVLLLASLALFVAPDISHANQEATAIINELRGQNGRKSVKYSRKLEQIARAHAEDMRQMKSMTHTGSDGSTPGKRARKARYKWCYISENVAQGPWDLGQVMQAWAESKPHLKNMLNRKAREFGVAEAPGGYWVMVLARPGCR